MDQLTLDCIAARRAGLTYGQYIATKPIPPAAVRFPKEAARGQEKRLVCALCGEEIPSNTKRRKYCSPKCADIMCDRQRRACEQRRREAAKQALYII